MSLKMLPLKVSFFQERLDTITTNLHKYTNKDLARRLAKLALAADSETAIITCQTYEIEQSTPPK